MSGDAIGGGSHENDPALLIIHNAPRRLLRCIEDAAEIRGYDMVPLRRGNLQERGTVANPGVGHQDINTTKAGIYLLICAGYLFWMAYIDVDSADNFSVS